MPPEKLKNSLAMAIAWMFKSPLRLFIVLFVSISIFAASVFLTVDANLRHLGRSQAAAYNANAGKLIAKIIEERFEGIATYTESYSRRHVIRTALVDRDQVAMQALLKEMVDENGAVYRAFMADAAGTTLAIYPPDPAVIGVNFAYRQWYQAVAKSGKTVVSEIYRTAAMPKPIVIAVATPVMGKDGHVQGYIVSQVRVDSLSDWVKEHSPTKHSNVYIVDRQGNVAQSSNPATGEIVNFGHNQALRPLMAGSSLGRGRPHNGYPKSGECLLRGSL